jgi:hypothetical protein
MGAPNKESIPTSSPLHLSMIIPPKAKFGLRFMNHHMADRQKLHEHTNPNVGILNEEVLTLVFRRLNWDLQTLCSIACTSRRMRAIADRILFFELCLSRVPRLVTSLLFTSNGRHPGGVTGSSPRIPGGWGALAKLLLFCCGCEQSKISAPSDATRGHFAPVSRFSKTSGKSFLVRRCWGDVLYVSDPCEHANPAGEEEDLGVYRYMYYLFLVF